MPCPAEISVQLDRQEGLNCSAVSSLSPFYNPIIRSCSWPSSIVRYNSQPVMPGRVLVIALVIAVAAFLWRLAKPSQVKRSVAAASSQAGIANPTATPNVSAGPPTVQDPAARRREVLEKIQRSLATPITFYGRVIDQNGDPVPGATVNYNALDKFDAPGSQYQGKSDSTGAFSITGIGGAALSVGVRKEGYYMIDGKSASAFAYGVGADSTRRVAPTENNPAILVLQKAGIPEPLVSLSTGGIKVPKNGTPVSIDLATGERTFASANCLRVEVRTQNHAPNAAGPYHWQCRVSVPGGGLVERKEQFDFEAPAAGYQQSDEIVMLSKDPSWKKRFKKSYFARFPSGNYARLQFEFTSGGDHFFMVESFFNPRSGSRNLEFDPQNVVRAQ